MFETVPYGFTDIYGIKWDQPQIDLYNKVSEEIHQREIDGHYTASESMLDNRHRIYNIPLYSKKKGEIDDRKRRRREVKVTFKNGDVINTAINGTKEEVENYYLNNKFNVSSYREGSKEEPLTTGKSVIFLS
jgi:hypothetical protein